MKIVQLNHIAVHVEDVERSCRWYERALKLSRLARPAFTFPGAWFRLGVDQELHLIGDRHDPVFSASRGNHFALLVDDLAAWEKHFIESDIPHRPRQDRPDGAEQIFLRDPDGHAIELSTKPPRPAELL